MIETYLLRGLAEIERCGSFTAAAKALRVSQPALSRAMRKLEGELDVPLFERGAGRTVLSSVGRLAAGQKEVAPQPRRIFELGDDFLDDPPYLQRMTDSMQ